MQTSESQIIETGTNYSSIIWGKPAGNGKWVEQISPVDGTCFHKAKMIDGEELSQLFLTQPSASTPDQAFLDQFCSRFSEELQSLRSEILHATKLETAFNVVDSEEVVESSIDFLRGFPEYFRSIQNNQTSSLSHSDDRGARRIDLISIPYGTVAAILPQSAFLYLSVTCILNALATGNRVIVRSPAQSACSAQLLSAVLSKMGKLSEAVSVVLASSRGFLDAACRSDEPIIIHYLGSSSHAPDILSKCFESGKSVIIDGEGNCWIYVDSDVSVDFACEILTSGALRYNGETCTSINGAVIHPKIFEELGAALAERWSGLGFGHPLDPNVQIGPVLDESQAKGILETFIESGASIAVGGTSQGNILAPTLAVEPSKTSNLVREGFFGPALWIASGDFSDFCSLWKLNRYPLCAGIFSNSPAVTSEAIKLPSAARIVLNGDPSHEYMYEPWGGYPSTGNNPVSHWYEKYLRTVQVDRQVK